MSVTHCSGIPHAKAGTAYRKFYKHMGENSPNQKVLNCTINNLTTEEILEKLNNFTTVDIKVTNELIKRLSITVTKLGGTIDNDDNKSIVESVDKHLPDPDYKNTTIKASSNKIEQIVNTIAKIINDDVFTSKVIDTDIEIHLVIRDINIYLYDLSYSLNDELLQSKLVLNSTIDKLNSLNALVPDDNKSKDNLSNLIKDFRVSLDVLDTNEEIVTKEINQHINKFKHINGDVQNWDVEDGKLQGDTIARVLSTIKHVVTIAYLNNTILSSICSSVPKVKDIYKVLRSISRNNKEEFKIITQVDSVKNFFTNRNSIVGGGTEFDFASEVATSVGDLSGGGDEIEGGARIELEGLTPEQIEKKKKKDRATEAVREYVSEMNVDINEFSEHIYEASKFMGTTTYDTSKLRDYLENMKWVEGLRDPNVYLAMVGYYLDDSYRSMASQYEERLEKTARGLKELGKHLPGTSASLNKAAGNIHNIIKTVDHFQDLLKTLLVGVCLEDIRDVVSEMPHAMGNIHLAINRLYHALNISQMRKMVKKCSTDLCHYSKNYPELLALTVGGRRADLEREYQILTADCPKNAGSILDPLTGKKLEFDPTKGTGSIDTTVPTIPGVGLSDTEAKARLTAETLQPGGILLTRCSLIWRYRNLVDTREALANQGPPTPGSIESLQQLLKSKPYLENFDKFLKEVEGEFRAKHRVYKALESLDLLLSVFTKEVAGDIDLMKEVKKYLEDTKVYTKWFTDYTGDLLAAIFEGMPAYVSVYDQPGTTFENLKKSDEIDNDESELKTFAYPDVNNPNSGCSLGSPEYNTLTQDLRNPVCISFYYKQLANTIRQSGGLPVYGKATGVPGMKGATKLRKTIDEFYNNFQALKNIFHSFITLYNRIISRGVKSKSLMTPSQIYYSILSYLKQSALARRLQPGDQNCHNMCEGSLGFRGVIDDPGYLPCIPFRTTWYTSLVGMIMPAYYPTREELRCYSIQEITGYPRGAEQAKGDVDKQYRNNIANTYKSVYETEDRLCAMGIKSIASVVLSCMGLFTIQQQPVNMGLQKTVRSIIGGGGENTAQGGLMSLTSVMGDEVRDANTTCATANCCLFDCYYYVTRLCEFYKLLFKNLMEDEKACQNVAKDSCLGNMRLREDERYDCKIRLPISLEGDFGKILFVVANNNGVYGERDACIILNQINKLSSKYRSVDDMLCGLISDVNRRFSCALDEESQFKFESLEPRLGACPETLSTLGSTYCVKRSGCKPRGSQTTGSMPFEDEHPDDSDVALLDDTITPSDSLMEVAQKYIGYNSQLSGCRVGTTVAKERQVAKFNFCGEFKLFHKLARMRSMLDEMFDEYLRTKYDECRDNKKPRTLKHFPLSTDFYRESFHEDFVDQMKMRCSSSARGNKKFAFAIATDLLNSKGRGTIEDKVGGNRDTLFAFSETVALMANCLYNTRNILRTCLEDVAIFSSERLYHDFHTINLSTTILQAPLDRDFFWNLLQNSVARARNDYPRTIIAPEMAPRPGLKNLSLGQCWEFEKLVIDVWQENADVLNTLYMTLIFQMLKERGGIKLLGIGNMGSAARMKNAISSIWYCKPEMRPHNIAKAIVLGGQYSPGLKTPQIPGQPPPTEFGYSDLPSDKKALLIKETINQVLLRFDLTAIQSNSIGTIARLSSSLDGLVSTTISNQGTYMDIAPVQNLVIDCMGELKNYASRFYDVLPTNTMAEYYNRSELDSAGIRASIYDMEYDFTTYFEPHIYHKIKRLPLIATVNATMTTVHKGLVGDLSQVLFTPDQSKNTPDNKDLSTILTALPNVGNMRAGWHVAVVNYQGGGNSIVNAIMPNHYEPHKINIDNDLIPLTGGNVIGGSNKYVDLFKQFTGTSIDPSKGQINNPCLSQVCTDFSDVDWTNIRLIDPISNGDNIEALLPAFNHGIRSMIVSFYDYGARKIYKGVLDMFMTDKVNDNVENLENSYPDLFAQTVASGDHLHLAMPQPGAILCTSIAVLLRLLFTSTNAKTRLNEFTYDSISEIKNLSVIEVMKLKLPMFREYFIKLVNKCRVVRGFLTKGCGSRENKRRLISVLQPFSRLVGGVPGEHVLYTLNEANVTTIAGGAGGVNTFDLYLPSATIGEQISLAALWNRNMTIGTGDVNNPASNVQPLDAKLGGHEGRLSDDTLYSPDTTDEWRYGYFMEIISNIEDSCIAIANQCDNMLSEFPTDDQYMAPGADYIEKHKKRFDHPTFRPLSLTSAFTSLLPAFKNLHNLNTKRDGTAFKLQYGAKGILFSDDMKFLNSRYLEPVMCAIRAGTKNSTVRIDTSSYGHFAKNYLSLFRFNYSVLNYSQICAVAGDYKSSDFKGGDANGDCANIEGGTVTAEGIITEYLNKFDLSQLHIAGTGRYYTPDQSPVIQNVHGLLSNIDGRRVKDNKENEYTCRQIDNENANNKYKIWLLEYLYNYIHHGHGDVVKNKYKKEFNNAAAQNWINNFNVNIGDDPQQVTDWIGLYNLCGSGTLTSGKGLCIETLQEAGPSILRILNKNIGGGAPTMFNIDGRNYDKIFQTIKENPRIRSIRQVVNVDTRIQSIRQVVNVDTKSIYGVASTSVGETTSDKGTRYDSVWRSVAPGDPPPPAGAGRTYNILFIKVYRNNMRRLRAYLSSLLYDIPVATPIAAPAPGVPVAAPARNNQAYAVAIKAKLQNVAGSISAGTAPDNDDLSTWANYKLPNWFGTGPPANARPIWLGNEQVPIAPVIPGVAGPLPALVQLTGGAPSGSNYDLMKSGAIGAPSGLIYTTVPSITPEMLMNIIGGDDVNDLIDIMIEVINDGGGDRDRTAIECGHQAMSGNQSEQRGSLIALLIEKNINPINVHSMQRFIPFANIYNYSYTFDRFVYTMYNIPMPWMDIIHAGYGQGGTPKRDEHCTRPGQQIMCFKNIFQSTDPTWQPGQVNAFGNWATSTPQQNRPSDMLTLDVSSSYYADIVKETFIRMMMDPYAHIDQYVYGVPVGDNAMGANFGPVTRMMRGYDKLGMGIPKFLSDQLLTKSLLNSMYLGGQYGNSVECGVYRFNLQAPPQLATEAAQVRQQPTPDENLSAVTSRQVAGGAPVADLLGPARLTEMGRHRFGRSFEGLAAPVSLPSGRDIATWPAHEQDHVLRGQRGTFGLDQGITLSDSGMRPSNYGVDAIDSDPAKARLVTNQLTFYDPDTRQVLTYDLTKVFQLTNATAPKIPGTNPQKEANLIEMFRYEGYERFNTQLVRNIVFITNLQRMMRYSLNMWLSRAYGAVSRDHRALSAEVTERRLGDSIGVTDDREYEDIQQSWI